MTPHQPSTRNSGYPPLVDSFDRRMNYLRLAVTDRCNLRCHYCMPVKGLDWIPRPQIMTYEEMHRLVKLFVEMGVEKLRLTGGEPFLRTDLIHFLREITALPGLTSVHITTNGVLTAPFVPALKEMGIAGLNLSLDTLNRERFRAIAHRDAFSSVLKTFHCIREYEIPLKINMVVMEGINTDEIIPISRLAENNPIEVRFIEQMPFNGNGGLGKTRWNWEAILQVLKTHYPTLRGINQKDSTARVYRIPGFVGTLGIIGGYSRIFCSTCSRIRVTPRGLLKTCLYDRGVLNVKEMMRQGKDDASIQQAIRQQVLRRAENGFEAEKRSREAQSVSMATIGG